MRKALFSLSGWLMTTALFFFASAVRAQGARPAPPVSARATGKAGAAPAEGFRLEPGALAPAQPVASTPPLSASPGPVPEAPPGDPGHAGLGVAKGAGDVVNLDWNGTGPYDVTQSNNPQFTLGVTTLAAGTTATALSTTVARSVFFDVAARGLGEVSAAVRGIGSLPIIPPVLSTVGARGCAVRPCAYPGDTITMDGANFDPLSVSNFITLNGRPASLNTAAPNTASHLEATVPFGSTVSGVIVCAFGTCTPRALNLDVLVTGPEKGLTNIGAVAFDDGRDGAANGYQAWIADRGTNAVYQVDPDLARTQAPTSRLTMNAPSIPSLTFKDGAIPVASAAGGDAVALLPRAASAPDFSSTRDGGNSVCWGANSSSVPLVTGMALNPRDSSNTAGAFVWLLDNATGKVRRVAKGTTLTDLAGNIDPAVGGFTFAPPRGDPFPLVYFPDPVPAVQGIDGNRNVWALRPAACTATAYSFVETTIIAGAQGYTTSERFDFGWYGSTSHSFARGKADHIGYLMFSRPTTVIRGNDPELFVVPTRPTRVLISKQVATDKYPVDCTVLPADAPCQSADRRYRFTVYSYVPTTIAPYLYLHLADPKDTAPYAPAPGAAPAGCDKSVPGPGASADGCDNKSWGDNTDDFGLTDDDASGCPTYTPPSGQTKKWLCVANPGVYGYIFVNALITKRYAGDNYQLRASFTNFIPGTVGYDANYHIKGESGIVTAWKRVYVERDEMFRRGALLARDFDPATCGTTGYAGCNIVEVFDWGAADRLKINDKVTLFQTDRPFEGATAVTAKVIDERPGFNPNTRFIQLDVNLKLSVGLMWAASSDNPVSTTPPTINFSIATGRSAALGALTNSVGAPCLQATINGPNACFYDADPSKIPQAFGDAFTEFMFPPSGAGAIPFLPQSFFDFANIQQPPVAMFHYMWFANKNPVTGGPIPPDNTPGNYIHVIGAIKSQKDVNPITYRGGYTVSTYDMSYLFIKTYEDQGGAADIISRNIQNATAHEPGHQFELNRCHVNPTAHDADGTPAWCDAANSHCGLGGAATVFSLMVTSIDQNIDTRFDVEDLLSGDAACAPQFKLDSAIRTHSDPN